MRVGLDAQVDVLGDEDRRVFRLRLLNAGGERQNPVVHRILGEDRLAVAVFVERDLELAAVRQIHAGAQAALAAKAVEHPRNRARVAAQLGGFALEPVNLLDDLDGHEDIVFLEIDERVGVVEQDVGVENVIFHVEIKRTVALPPAGRACLEYMNGVVKISLKLALIFSGRKNVSTIILQTGEVFSRRSRKTRAGQDSSTAFFSLSQREAFGCISESANVKSRPQPAAADRHRNRRK